MAKPIELQGGLVAACTNTRPGGSSGPSGAGVLVGRGLGPTEGRTIRVGLAGRTATDEMVDRLLAALSRPRRGQLGHSKESSEIEDLKGHLEMAPLTVVCQRFRIAFSWPGPPAATRPHPYRYIPDWCAAGSAVTTDARSRERRC